jgi:hypothetical protein
MAWTWKPLTTRPHASQFWSLMIGKPHIRHYDVDLYHRSDMPFPDGLYFELVTRRGGKHRTTSLRLLVNVAVGSIHHMPKLPHGVSARRLRMDDSELRDYRALLNRIHWRVIRPLVTRPAT